MAIVTANFLQFSPSALSVKPREQVAQTCCSYQIFPFSNRRRPCSTSISASSNRTKSSSHLTVPDFDDEEEDEEDDMDVIPFREMKKWFENRPKGFGEGKNYDTSLEETLWQEIQQSRKAQLANINKLKSGSTQSDVKKDKAIPKATEHIPSGIPVRVENLPKKRNINRDLKMAFKEFPGINHISPAVSGSKKTRDPVCRGFALIYLVSDEAAHRFVQAYSGKSIKFGKIEKRIFCAIKSPTPSDSNFRESTNEEDSQSDADETLWDSEEESLSEESDDATFNGSSETAVEIINFSNGEPVLRDGEDIEAGFENLSLSKTKKEEDLRMGKDSDATKDVSSPSKPKENRGVKSKKHKAREKGSNLKVPGSARRLKIQEKVVLTGVFSKYGKKSGSALPVES